MAKVTIILTDDEDGRCLVEFIPDPDFEGDSDDLTLSQDLSMQVMSLILDNADAVVQGDETDTLQ